MRYGWGPGEVEIDPCQENQQAQNPAAPPEWSCGADDEGFFVIAKSRSGNFFYLKKVTSSSSGVEQLCTSPGVGDCNSDWTW
jgi:hypothetical protein